jgi:glycosyltransferase involved in cell wall biosynthesis
MQRILLSAFACDPSKGSEPGNGWNWAIGLAAKGYEVHCVTRSIGRTAIQSQPKLSNLFFYFIDLPFNGEKLYYKSNVGMYSYYLLWQWKAYKVASKLNKSTNFSLVHHVTWGSTQMGSFMYKLNIPFIFGPAGGGQIAPSAFSSYFQDHWQEELKRERITRLMLKFNPAFKQMVKKATVILCSNPDTLKMVEAAGAKLAVETLDAALPYNFFPPIAIKKEGSLNGELRLLWVGRLMPRKGILLILDVMKELKDIDGITLTIVGDGEMRLSLLNKIAEYGLQQSINYVGTVPFKDVSNYYKSHDAFFFTSLRDSCPAQLIEAMAFSLPVITIDLHGQSIIVNDDNGIKCKCVDPKQTILDLKQAILNLYNNPDLLISKSIGAREFSMKQTWESKINSITEKYYPHE